MHPSYGQESSGNGIRFRDISYEEALKASKKEGKPVFMHGYASWCHYCVYMVDSVYTDSLVGAFFNKHFISIKSDLEKEEAELNKRLKSHTYPTMVFFDANGEVMHRGAGRRYKQMFLELGREALDPRRQLRTWLGFYNNGKVNADTAYQVLRKIELAGMETQEPLLQYLDRLKPEEITKPENWRIIKELFKDVDAPFMKVFIDKKHALIKLNSTRDINDKILAMYDFEFYMRNRLLDSAGYDALKQQVKASKLDIADMIVDYADLNRFKAASQFDNYFDAAEPFVEKYCLNKASLLYEIAHVFYEKSTDSKQLAKAEQWMRRCVELDASYNNNILLCGLLVQQRKKAEAKIVADHAMKLAAEKKLNNKTALLMLDRIERM